MSTLRDRVSDTVPDSVELFERNGEVWGTDDHGDFKLDPMTGAEEPQEGRCGAVCKYTMERYGQTRYCTGMPESTFVDDGSDFCKTHKSHEALMERAQELFKHGYFATNYINFAKYLSTPKFLFAVEMVGGLFEMSTHDFEIHEERRVLDASDTDLIKEDEVEVKLPIPQNTMLSVQANELWTAACKEVMQQNMSEAIFEDGVTRDTLVKSADMEGKITDTIHEKTEHHLLLPVSRLPGDIKDHMKNGGVTIEDDESGMVTFQKNDYTLDVSPVEDKSQATEADQNVAEDFAAQLEAQDDAAEITVD